MIKVNHITKSYDAIKALDDLSLSVDSNEVVSIIGHSGSGKSTLLNCIAGLVSYDSGSISVNARRNGVYNGIGMVFQQGNLFPHLNVLQNLMLAPEQILGVSRKDAEEEALLMIDKVGLWSKRFNYPGSLSIGQRQRVAIARCLMMKPSVLLLDEPSSSLDPVSTSEVYNVLSTLKKNDITILIVTHNIDFATGLSDRIVYMHNGKIIEQGTPSEIINYPKNNLTKSFINHCINMVYEIPSSKFDHPELNARIENFCMRYRLPSTEARSTQLVIEELLNIIPLDSGLRLVLTKSDSGLVVDAVLNGSNQSLLPEEDLEDDLSYTILSAMCSSIEEIINESGDKVIRLKIKKGTI